MSIENQLAEMEELESRMDKTENADHRDALYQEQDDKMEAFINSLEGLNQNQFVRYMNLVREMSWDIPSALLVICEHGSDVSDELTFFMHRYTDEDEKWIVEHIKRYGDGVIHGRVSTGDWELTDQHFKEVHGLDLKDSRINWSFDT